MLDIGKIRAAVKACGVDFWLFCNFHHRDLLADRILGLPLDSTNSRYWFYLVPAEGDPYRIVHGVESGALDSLPGVMQHYSSRETLEERLAAFKGRRVAVHWSETVSAISYLDLGTADLLRKSGLTLVPGDRLIQRLQGILGPADIECHEAAGRNLHEIVRRVWARVDERYRSKARVTEVEVQSWILALIRELGMETDHLPIVAAGIHTNDPHFAPNPATDLAFAEGDVIQFDLWARLEGPGTIFADISWLGIFGSVVPEQVKTPCADLFAARDQAVSFIAGKAGKTTGSEVDAIVRDCLIGAGHEAALRHRTGHSIDVEVHGSGVNLDSLEFPDRRNLVDGSCFSVEPGLYFADFGLRTEIDVYLAEGKPVISGGKPQTALLLCGVS
ncbi:MAG: M24 family metallopeptidase [Spirochaetota bacterium]